MKILILILFNIIFIASTSNAITLSQAISLAIEHNQEISRSSVDINIQKENTKGIKATRFGEIDFLNSFNKYDSYRVLQPLTIKKAEDIFSIGTEYQVPLFTGFEITENIKISKLSEKLNIINKKLTKNQIIFNVKSIYFKILSLKKQLLAMRHYKGSLNRLYEDVLLMVKTGKKPEVDLYKIEYDLKNTDAVIVKLKTSIDSLKYALKEQIGKRDLKIDKIEDIKFTQNFNPENININKLPSIIKITTRNKIAKENIKKVRSEYFPKIYLNSNIFENYGNGDDVNIWNISLNLKFNIFDFGKRKSDVKKAILEKEKTELEKQEILLKKEREIKDAINKIKAADADIKAYKNQIKFAKEEERIEKIKYKHGVSNIYDYLYAKSRRYLAESRYFDALYNREQSIAYYEYVIEKMAIKQ